MDLLTLLGFAFAIIAIVVGSILKGAGVGALVSGAAFMIVVVGTFAAILVQTPLPVLRHGMRMFGWILKPPRIDGSGQIGRIVEWSQIARKQGLLGLEPTINHEQDPFVRKALQLLVDGTEPDQIRSIMEVELSVREQADHAGAKVFEGMGIYSPTLGIIGAVLGLMAVMQNLADPSKLGAGIAAAFTATVYGIGLANLLFLPAAAKLKAIVARQSQTREMIIEGMISIALGENPRSIESKLQGYLQH
ncbi:MAG: flagellar motor protein [Sinobacteraceae bacterium]|nr:flagellar motor protein [Nevskiaceae bacterium]MCP5339100.1 flagellar motor protein [Nevskiaceae bacterium]MCP5360009.1 flagellar motor protein [Nevskiaceae bacterium]MCP5466939.1 flagellar motor protein [Nevskiaceae bacterium]MCP5472171.1 flagellar motor protein [Nevskiaceae bacterium]